MAFFDEADRKITIHRRGEGIVQAVTILCGVLHVTAQRVLAWQKRPESAHTRRRSAIARAGASLLTRQPPDLRPPRVWADHHRAGPRDQSQARRAPDAGGWDRCPKPPTIQGHQDERPRSADRRECVGPSVHRGGASEFLVGSSGKIYVACDPRALLALRRWLGGECRQRSTPDSQGASSWRSNGAVPRLACCIIPTRVPPTPARPTSGRWPRRAHLQYEPSWQLLRQRGDGELLRRRTNSSCGSTSRAAATPTCSCSTTSKCS